MLANNEIETVQDLAAIADIANRAGVLMHCDAAQGLGYLPLDVTSTRIDLLSMSAHKIYGPKGIGALYVSRRVAAGDLLRPQIFGGGHEQGYRAGSLNVPALVGFGAACAIMKTEGPSEASRLQTLRDQLQQIIEQRCPGVRVHGYAPNRHPGNLNISVKDTAPGALLLE